MHRLCLSLLAGLLLLGALASGASAFEVRATAADNGKTARLIRGDILQVTLTENPSTGYGWRIVTRPSAAVLRLLSDRFVSPPATNPPTVGAPGRHVYRWRAAGAGTTSLKLQLFPPGQGRAPVQTFRLTIVVS
jgi:predicted secreted protein